MRSVRVAHVSDIKELMPRWTHRLIALGKRPSSVRAFEAKETNGEVWVNLPEAH